jgi:hypothetical protein
MILTAYKKTKKQLLVKREYNQKCLIARLQERIKRGPFVTENHAECPTAESFAALSLTNICTQVSYKK